MTPEEIKEILLSLKPQEDIVEITFRGFDDTEFAVVEKITGDEVVFCRGEGIMPEDFYPRYTVYGKPIGTSVHRLQPQFKQGMEIVKIKKIKSKMLVCILKNYQRKLTERAEQLRQERRDFLSIIRG